MKIMFIGSNGFIGSNLVEQFMKSNPKAEVACVDADTYAAHKNSPSPKICSVFYQGSIQSYEVMESIFADFEPEIVVNLAAESHVDRSLENPYIFHETNIIGVQTIVDLCIKYKSYLLHFSTDEVLGPIPKPDFASEDAPLNPTSSYAISKAAGELIIKGSAVTEKFKNWCIVRPTNQYGPYQHKEKMIPKIIENLKNGTPVPVYGVGQEIRNWMYVYDLIDKVNWLIWQKYRYDQWVMNIAGDNEITNLDLVKTIADLMKVKPLIELVENRKGHDCRYAMSSSLSSRSLTNLYTGLGRTITWYLHNDKA
jgi:dTDP-glucose 4,6-dehydratase